MPKDVLTAAQVAELKKRSKMNIKAKLHPDEMTLGGDSRYANPKWLPKKTLKTPKK
jgi:hypothetical protein